MSIIKVLKATLISLGIGISLALSGCIEEPKIPNLETQTEPRAGDVTAATCAAERKCTVQICAAASKRLQNGQCVANTSAGRAGAACNLPQDCATGFVCVSKTCQRADTRTPQQICQANNPNKTCNADGEVVEEEPSPGTPPENNPIQLPTPGTPGTSDLTDPDSPAEPAPVQPVPVDADGVLTQLPASLHRLSADDFTQLTHDAQSTTQNCQSELSTDTAPPAGAPSHQGKDGEPTNSEPNPAQPGVTDLENPTTTSCPANTQTPQPVSHVCLNPAYRQAVLQDSAGVTDTYTLIGFSTHAYLSYTTTQTDQLSINPEFPIYTLIDNTMLSIQKHHIVQGVSADTTNAIIHHQPNSLFAAFKFKSASELVLQTQLTLTSTPPTTPVTWLDLGSYRQAAITLFAFKPETTIESAYIHRNFSRDNTIKVDLQASGNCVGIYENTAQTKYPVMLVTTPPPTPAPAQTP